MPHNHVLEFENNYLIQQLFGAHNANLSHLEKKLGISISDRGNTLTLSGKEESVEKAEAVIASLIRYIENKQDIGIAEVDAALRFVNKPHTNGKGKVNGHHGQDVVISTKKKSIAARSPNQAAYMNLIKDNPMVFGLGPAGTGKTYLAVAMGVSMFMSGEVERLIFCRPAVEAGERLGFLPGDMKEKVDPYLRPIYDAMQDMMPSDVIMKKMETGEIEIAPLAFMRGRTLANAFVILDEAQNTTATQMKMFLTRMGESSRMVVTGDLSQIDLPKHEKSGLLDAVEILEGIDDIKFMRFTADDVVRHPLVSKIIHAYDKKSK